MPLRSQSRLDSLQHLDEVVVAVRALPKEVIPVQQLAGEQLSRLSSHSVADALRYFSGLQIKDYGGVGGLKTVNIRSMGTNHVGVFYDGVELGNAQNGTVDLGRFSLDNMESVTLYNGQKSAIFQPAKDFGSAGSIYLQSRIPVFSGKELQHVKATFKTGSFGLVNPSLLWERKLTEQVSTSWSAEYLYTTGKYKFSYRKQDGYDTTAVRQNGDVNALRVEGGFYGKLPRGYWRAKSYLYRSERGYPGAIVRNKFSHEDRQWDTNFFTQGVFKKDVADWYSLMAHVKYAYDYLHYLADPHKDESLMYTNNHLLPAGSVCLSGQPLGADSFLGGQSVGGLSVQSAECRPDGLCLSSPAYGNGGCGYGLGLSRIQVAGQSAGHVRVGAGGGLRKGGSPQAGVDTGGDCLVSAFSEGRFSPAGFLQADFPDAYAE